LRRIGMQKKPANDQVQKLIIIGKEKGYLTYDEVNDSLPTAVIISDRIDEIVILFGEEDIELISSSEEDRFRQGRDQEAKAKSGKAAGDGGIDLTPGTIGKTDDPVRMYLREMGTVPLLTREGEVEIAKRIEVGRKVVLEVISRMPFVVENMLGWISKLGENQVRLRDILILDPDQDETERLDAIEDGQPREDPGTAERVCPKSAAQRGPDGQVLSTAQVGGTADVEGRAGGGSSVQAAQAGTAEAQGACQEGENL
jgi:RNA polymerase primary sigma factor